ncbi:ADP ribosylation factor like GTPase 10, partial [Homo sapiens]
PDLPVVVVANKQVLPYRFSVVPGMSDVGATGKERHRGSVISRTVPAEAHGHPEPQPPHHSIRGAAFRRAFRFRRFRLTL